ncbi:hypothetical protein [Leptospirillum ferriphilum]|uniref:hypothetical protein n=1 Tax=Leptospirillum ferriphilum TaxID=178606 RepID=UPI0011DCDD15|nr:hypothetical protein [Leptospirillum ferriphilum]
MKNDPFRKVGHQDRKGLPRTHLDGERVVGTGENVREFSSGEVDRVEAGVGKDRTPDSDQRVVMAGPRQHGKSRNL